MIYRSVQGQVMFLSRIDIMNYKSRHNLFKFKCPHYQKSRREKDSYDFFSPRTKVAECEI